MENKLIQIFVEFEGLSDQLLLDSSFENDNEEDDPTFRAAVAATLSDADIDFEVKSLL